MRAPVLTPSRFDRQNIWNVIVKLETAAVIKKDPNRQQSDSLIQRRLTNTTIIT